MQCTYVSAHVTNGYPAFQNWHDTNHLHISTSKSTSYQNRIKLQKYWEKQAGQAMA